MARTETRARRFMNRTIPVLPLLFTSKQLAKSSFAPSHLGPAPPLPPSPVGLLAREAQPDSLFLSLPRCQVALATVSSSSSWPGRTPPWPPSPLKPTQPLPPNQIQARKRNPLEHPLKKHTSHLPQAVVRARRKTERIKIETEMNRDRWMNQILLEADFIF